MTRRGDLPLGYPPLQPTACLLKGNCSQSRLTISAQDRMSGPPFWTRSPQGVWREHSGGGLHLRLEEGEAWFSAEVHGAQGDCLIQAALEPLSPVPVAPNRFKALAAQVRQAVNTPAPLPLEAQTGLLALQEALRQADLPVPSFEVSALQQKDDAPTSAFVQWSFLLEGESDLPPVRIGFLKGHFRAIFRIFSGGIPSPRDLRLVRALPENSSSLSRCSFEH